MTLIRGGRSVTWPPSPPWARPAALVRFHLDRDVDFVQHAITKKRLLAGLGLAPGRQLHFFIAEEGITAAADAVISVRSREWTMRNAATVIPSTRGSRDQTRAC
jgi:hypothetical protein